MEHNHSPHLFVQRQQRKYQNIPASRKPLFKVNHKETQRRHPGVFIVNFDQISHIALVFY